MPPAAINPTGDIAGLAFPKRKLPPRDHPIPGRLFLYSDGEPLWDTVCVSNSSGTYLARIASYCCRETGFTDIDANAGHILHEFGKFFEIIRAYLKTGNMTNGEGFSA